MAEDSGPGYPMMLYKFGSTLEWDGELFDIIVVNDADEAKAAKADGFSVGKPVKAKAAAKDEAKAKPKD